MQSFDVIVIGSGPAGEGASMMAAKNGLSCAIVERYFEVGGGCTHWGTIPSKALRQAVQSLAELRRNPFVRPFRSQINVGFPELRSEADRVISSQTEMRRRFYERNQVPILRGEARFVDAHTIEVSNGGRCTRYSAKNFIIATGSRPYHPPGVDFDHPRMLDSDSVLKFEHTPRSITIYGAGVIGCEYASIFVNLGIKVSLINTQDRLLSFLDDEITEALSYHLRDQGVMIRHNEQFQSVELSDDCAVLKLASGREIRSDVLLWANGRTGNTDNIGLETLGLKANSRGQIKVDEHFCTEVPHVYAVGDITGPPALASAAYDQGRYAAQHMMGIEDDADRVPLVPAGIYTLPEISAVGRTERELQQAGIPYEIGHAMFKSLARAQMVGETTGMLKLLFNPKTLEVLGVSCFGRNASEIVHIGAMVMANPSINSMKQFVNLTFNYPTMAEAYRVAAFNGLNRV